jgi:hypothetical protein
MSALPLRLWLCRFLFVLLRCRCEFVALQEVAGPFPHHQRNTAGAAYVRSSSVRRCSPSKKASAARTGPSRRHCDRRKASGCREVSPECTPTHAAVHPQTAPHVPTLKLSSSKRHRSRESTRFPRPYHLYRRAICSSDRRCPQTPARAHARGALRLRQRSGTPSQEHRERSNTCRRAQRPPPS